MSDNTLFEATAPDAALVAIVGMAGRFPGASSVAQFWRNLRDGVESLTGATPDELVADGIDPCVLDDPKYVNSRGALRDIEWFDAQLFEMTPRTVEVTDPQQRLFLECAWEALEHAACSPDTFDGRIGVFAGASTSSYFTSCLARNYALQQSVGNLPIRLGNEPDFLSALVSYKLNLRGPSINVMTACSSSLVAVHLASHALLSHQCDAALAGGVSVGVPHSSGYFYREGAVTSPDGHCRAFDARAAGTVFGGGVGVVVLKRLADALRDGDTVYAVLRGTAISNDGSLKMGFTAPSVEAQAEVIAEAQAVAGVPPESIGFVETHGTGTPLGDAVEIAALASVFRQNGAASPYCALGAVKTNVGHLDSAAGVTGLIKATLVLQHGEIPPTLHFERPNPELRLEETPLYVNAALRQWARGTTPRRAGVSAFGFGGQNAHAVLEEAPPRQPSGPSRRSQLIILSAKSETALQAVADRLESYLRDSDVPLADVAHTLRVGRRALEHRQALVCTNRDDAVETLAARDPRRIMRGVQRHRHRPVVLMFPGAGALHKNAARGVYETEPGFRAVVDYCADVLKPLLGVDVRTILFTPDPRHSDEKTGLTAAAIMQPTLFSVEYAFARLLMSWGIRPDAMVGHSVGEFAAACVGEVFTPEDALHLLVERGRLLDSTPPGHMVAVSASAREVECLLPRDLTIAAVNASNQVVVAGPTTAVDHFRKAMILRGVGCQQVATSIAFHSPLVDGAVEPFERAVARVALRAPRIPFVSCATGQWITEAEATSPQYWAQHLRRSVRFDAALERLWEEPSRLLLEVGPGRTLSNAIRRDPRWDGQHDALAVARHPSATVSDDVALQEAVARLWMAGADIDWAGFTAHETRHRVPLPTYPFERKKYWIAPAARSPDEQKLGTVAAPATSAQEPILCDVTGIEPADFEATDANREIERQVAQVWQEVMGTEHIDRHESMFNVGADSLTVAQLASRLNAVFDVELPLRVVFESMTIARMADAVTESLLEKLSELSDEEARQMLAEP